MILMKKQIEKINQTFTENPFVKKYGPILFNKLNVSFLLITILSIYNSETKAAPKGYFTGQFDANFKHWTLEPSRKTGQNYRLLLEQKLDFSSESSVVLQARGYSGTDLIDNVGSYDGSVSNRNLASELYPQDNYYQYKSGGFLFRAGYQQVVWGEAFGLFYSDFINPKDLRLSPSAPSEFSRRSLPMVNIKMVGSSTSLQLLYAPQSAYHLLPPPTRMFGANTLRSMYVSTIDVRKSSAPNYFEKSEFGAKFGFTSSLADISVYYYNYDDRMPYYEQSSDSYFPYTIHLIEKHERINSTGLASAFEAGGFMFRAEFLQTRNKKINSISATGIGNFQANENVFVVSTEAPSMDNYIFSVQYSDSVLSENPTGSSRSKYQSLISFRLQKTLTQEHNFEVIYTMAPHDKGGYISGNYFWPRNKDSEVRIGFESHEGDSDSQLGRDRDLNNFYISLRNFFRG